MNTKQPTPATNHAVNPAVAELQALRREFSDTRKEIEGLRADLKGKKPINVTDQVAKGVVIAGFFWLVTWQLLASLAGAIFGGR